MRDDDGGPRGFGWAIGVPLAIGIALVVAAIAVAVPVVAFVARATSTTGTYVGSVSRVGGTSGGTFEYPQFAYRPAPGRPLLTVTSTSGSTDQPYADGAKVRILFDPADPGHAVVPSFLTLWAGPALLGAAGIAFVVPPASVAIAGRRRRRPAS